MKKGIVGSAALALVFLVTGCGDSPDAVMKDRIKLENEAADALESAKDKDSAEKAKTRLADINKRLKDVVERARKIKLTKDQEKKLEEKYKDDMAKVEKRMEDALKKLQSNPEAVTIVQPAALDIVKTAEEARNAGLK